MQKLNGILSKHKLDDPIEETGYTFGSLADVGVVVGSWVS